MPYLDDLLIFSKNDEEHLEHLEKVLIKRLREHKLYARPKKCEFGKRRMKFLGHYVQCVDGKTTQICVDPEKIKAVQDWPRPTTQKEVLQFKGLAEFYRRFIKNFSDISAPLSALTGNAKWEWGTAQENAFTRLKTAALTQAPVLATPDYSKPFVVTCDASGYAVGAVLSQGDGDDVRVIAYESRKMTDVETRYPIHDKELLAVIYALKKWGYHLRGKKFVIVTDNWATKYIQSKPDLNHRQMNWMSTLAEFDFDIVHRPGKTNVVADALSRRTGSLLYIPQCDLRQKLMHEAHDAPLSGHLGRDKTLARLSRAFYWPRMHHMVEQYCRTCPSCQAIKPSHQAKMMGLLQPLPIPKQAGSSWSIMDFITGLPRTRRGHDAILTLVDRMIKFLLIIPTTIAVTAEGTAELFFNNVFKRFGMPESIISDRDPRFTSQFWLSLHKLTGIKLNMSTANHPQTDGQTENANRTVEDKIRAYVLPYHDDWDEHLTSCEFAYNDSSEHASHRFTPFYLAHGHHPRVPLTMLVPRNTESTSEPAHAFVKRVRRERERAIEALKQAQDIRMARNSNKHRRKHTFQVDDKVWLAASHVRLPHALTAKRKFQPRYYGPFRVTTKVVSDVAYKLELPPHFKIHPVIHISHLKANQDGSQDFPSRPEYKSPPPAIIVGEGETAEEYFSVGAIRNHKYVGKGRNRQRKFWIQWEGYGEQDNTWKSERDLRIDMEDHLVDSLISD
ncbi:hypothetical protein CEUSTIGMA_g11274.t1 [Chlamydomonas eustigma]|uniref:Integrase catalytic domain-containing protein n=1 Tax=Chlamydomonas eustigma TaxID=1157962 RepID=A0A250XLP3_9CHLO|nr:hypothetical protein CEUSTIGMA_g11274.t1 [Chlamydomonas eustigma]|eukprot:GAX83849.1 hypothetical protein CEUSTIGMA_g11274.t1 [Chlamydomonas eustigma]